jgi:hypothetical protein
VKRAAVLVVIAMAIVASVMIRSGSNTSAQAAVTHAFARTTGTGSSRFVTTFLTPAPGDDATRASGVMDYVNHRGSIQYGRNLEIRYDGDAMYARWAMPWQHEPEWVQYDADTTSGDPFDLDQRLMDDPARLLEFLTTASDSVRTVGIEDVRGVATTHYEGRLDFQKIVDNAPTTKREELQSYLDFISQDEPTRVPYNVWVDRDGIAHRVQVDMGSGFSLITEYFDFGTPVEVTRPPADQIVSLEEWTSELEAHTKDSDCGTDSKGETDDSEGVSVYLCIRETPLNGDGSP